MTSLSASLVAQNIFPQPGPGNAGIGTTSPTSLLHIINLSPNATPAPALTISSSYLVPTGQGSRDYLIINRDAVPSPLNIPAAYYLIVKNDGKVGIGTATPSAPLEITGETKTTTLSVTSNATVYGNLLTSGYGNFIGAVLANNSVRTNNTDVYLRPGSDVNHGLGFYDNTGQAKVFANTSINGPVLYGYAGGALATKAGGDKIALRWNNLQQVVIGNQAPNGVYAANYRLGVDGDLIAKRCIVQINQWSDDVFDENYQLTPLKEIEKFIKANKHLPEVPTEEKVCSEGISLGEMNNLLLRKIEELTLYIIAQQNQIDKLIINKRL